MKVFVVPSLLNFTLSKSVLWCFELDVGLLEILDNSPFQSPFMIQEL
jgi:hypothetical protein